MAETAFLRPFGAVHLLAYGSPTNGKRAILGCCFRVWGLNSFVTAAHCVNGIDYHQIAVLDLLADDPEKERAPVTGQFIHPSADLCVLTTNERELSQYHQFAIARLDLSFGAPLQAFGYVYGIAGNSFRVVPGFSMRDFDYEDTKYKYHAIELSAPIPRGTSGAPVFNGWRPNPLVGIAMGSISSELELRNLIVYQDDKLIEREKISEFTRYGLVLDIKPVLPWLREVIPGEPVYS